MTICENYYLVYGFLKFFKNKKQRLSKCSKYKKEINKIYFS